MSHIQYDNFGQPLCPVCNKAYPMFGANLVGICWSCARKARRITAEVDAIVSMLPSRKEVA